MRAWWRESRVRREWRRYWTPGSVGTALAMVSAVLAGNALDDGKFGSALTFALISITVGRYCAQSVIVMGIGR